MNTDVVLAAEGDALQVECGLVAAQAFIHANEARFTRFSAESELAQLNRAAGEWLSVSAEMYGVLRQAQTLAAQTGGLFDPTVLDALEAVGYSTSMDVLRVQGAGAFRPVSPAPLNRLAAIEFDAATRAVRLPHGLRLDLGGIAKGWIVERAARLLAEYSEACIVSIGGDLFAVGVPCGAAAWEVGLEDPRDPQQTLAILNVGPGAIATSSVTRRRWQQGGRVRHHLIDPRTGLPAETDWLSVTVIAAQATTAEAFAKALLVAGMRDADRIAAHQDDLTFIAVDRKGQVWGSPRAQESLHVNFKAI